MALIYSFIIWSLGAVFFLVLGIYALFARNPVHFWNIRQEIRVQDTKKYNLAMAKLWIVFAVLFELTGLPFLTDSEASYLIIPVLGSMFLSIGAMIVYTRIEKKHRLLS